MVANKTLIFKKIPTAKPVKGEHLVVESKAFDETPSEGGVSFSILYVSYDPYLRGKMRDPNKKSYTPPFLVGEPIVNDAVARVIKSDNPDYKEGDLVVASLPFAEYGKLGKKEIEGGAIRRKIDPAKGIDLGVYLGPLGMPGLTGYSSLHEIGKPKKGETIFVSSAAGAVGQIVGQIAKREGLKVIGSVGNDDKLNFILNELGFDAGFNYKKEKPADALKRLAPQGIDIYYENVGGEHLEAALEAMNQWGRIVGCGMISQYNTPEPERYGIKNLFQVISKRITMRGFIVFDKDFGEKYGKEHQETLTRWLQEGSYKAKIDVTEGIDNAADGLIGMLDGKNFGKAVLKIKDE